MTLNELLRHGLQVVLFNFALWGLALLANGSVQDWDKNLVYCQAIGLSIWAIIDLGRLPLLKPGQQGWPSLPRALLLVTVGIAGGWFVGSLLGDLYCGCSEWGILTRSPGRLRTTIAITLAASVVATYYFYSQGMATAQRERLAAAERDATAARLTLLQSQLEPHMLFNTLANLRVLITLDPPRAQAMLDRLIAFLRATLSASRNSVHSLATEFERLDDYLELMSVRMGERLQTRLVLPDDLRGVPVPPLLLQPLAENAIKHGLEPKVEGGRIEIAAARDGDMLKLSVRDTGVGVSPPPAAESAMQFGLQQVRQRLAALYGARASLLIAAATDAEGGTLARITFPLEPHATDRPDR